MKFDLAFYKALRVKQVELLEKAAPAAKAKEQAILDKLDAIIRKLGGTP